VGTTLGETLLIVAPNPEEPIPVDPEASKLAAAILVGLSPYVSWYGFYTQAADQFRSDLPGGPPRVFDLRTGEMVDIRVEDPRTSSSCEACQVAGKWAPWLAV
jgi:hypothetical protein